MHVFQSIRYLNSSELGIRSNLISISLIYVCTGEHGLVKSLKIRNFSHGLSHSLTYLLQTHNIPNPFFFFFKLYCLSDYHMLCALVSAIFLVFFFFSFVKAHFIMSCCSWPANLYNLLFSSNTTTHMYAHPLNALKHLVSIAAVCFSATRPGDIPV